MNRLIDWIDNRTGMRALAAEALFERIPGGARWRYVWGSTLSFALVVQFITGIFLWMYYAPSSQTAWASVYEIQNNVLGGWFLRGLHHFTAQAMTVLLVLHLMQVVIDGAYRAPREVNFWFGVLLLMLTLGLSLTGYLLPWDQKGFWATKVATNIAGITPVIGPYLQSVIVGGTEYGHHTLTRFFALHAGVIPGAIIVLLVGHIYLFRKHGITPKVPHRGAETTFWPDQVLMDAVACLAVLATVVFFVVRSHGAELGAPADATEPYSAARPEWYFLFLFQFLKYFPGGTEIWGAMVIPGLLMGVLCLMPFLGQWKLGHRFNLMFLAVMIFGAGLLTWQALREDRGNPLYRKAVLEADAAAERVKVLANSESGIPPAGAADLLRNDPLIQGPKLFAKNCASCHRYDGHDGSGEISKEAPAASDLKGFGSRAWIAGLLTPEKVASAHYFGGTKFKTGRMVKYVTKDVAALDEAGKQDLEKVVMVVSAEAGLRGQQAMDAADAKKIEEGRALFAGKSRCSECHQFHLKDEDATGPDLTGYGSKEWLVQFISNPKHPRFYGERNDRMPAFGDDKILNAHAIGLIADWLRGDWYMETASKEK